MSLHPDASPSLIAYDAYSNRYKERTREHTVLKNSSEAIEAELSIIHGAVARLAALGQEATPEFKDKVTRLGQSATSVALHMQRYEGISIPEQSSSATES